MKSALLSMIKQITASVLQLMVDTASGENGASVQLLAEAKRAQEDVTGYATVQSLRMAVKTALDLERTQRRRNANRKPPNVLVSVIND